MIERIRNEPVLVLAFIVGALTVVLQTVTDGGTQADAVNAVIVFAGAWLARSRVTPVVKL